MSERRGRGFWARIAEEVEAGATQKEAAARHGVAVTTVGYWVRRLERERESSLLPGGAIVPIRLVGEERRRVIVEGGRVEFEEGTDPSYVAAVVRALSRC